MILGNNFFLENDVKVDLKNKHLTGEGSTGSWDLYFNDKPEVYHRSLEIHVVEDVKINAGESVMVEVCISSLHVKPDVTVDDVFFEPRLDLGNLKGSPGVLKFTNNRASILVSSDVGAKRAESVVLKGTKLGCVSSIVDVQALDTESADLTEIDKVDLTHLSRY